MSGTIAYRDGKFLPKEQLVVPYSDLGFERGFGVFDYCRIRKEKITFLNDHLERLMHSQTVLNLHQSLRQAQLHEIVAELMNRNKPVEGYLKLMITGRMEAEAIYPVLTVFQDEYIPYPRSSYDEGIALILREYEKPFAEYKTTFYLGTLREFPHLLKNRAEDVLIYSQNHVRECSRCNIFIVKGDTLYTPSRNLLKGVTRKHIMNCAREHFFVVENDVSVEELFSADEVFISSTTRNIMPVVRIEDTPVGGGKPGKVTIRLMELFEEYCNHYVAN